jgi:hypothetical protein
MATTCVEISLAGAQTTNALVTAPGAGWPPLSPTAVHEVGLVAISATGWPLASLGKLPIGFKPPTVSGSVFAPPPITTECLGQLAVVRVQESAARGPLVSVAKTRMRVGPSAKQRPKAVVVVPVMV